MLTFVQQLLISFDQFACKLWPVVGLSQSKLASFAVGLPGCYPAPGYLIAELPWIFTVPRHSLFLGMASSRDVRVERRDPSPTACVVEKRWVRSFLVRRSG